MGEKIRHSEALAKLLEQKHYEFTMKERDDRMVYYIMMPLGKKGKEKVTLCLYEDGIVYIYKYMAYGVPDYKRQSVLEAINELNDQYRFISISLDKDGDVVAGYNYFMCEDDASAMETTTLYFDFFESIYESCYQPVIDAIEHSKQDEKEELPTQFKLDLFGGEC